MVPDSDVRLRRIRVMNVLVTGASGFLGRNLLSAAPCHWNISAVYNSDTGFEDYAAGLGRSGIRTIRCDLADANEVAACLSDVRTKWDACVYLAAKVDIPWSVREPRQDLLLNTASLLNVLERIHCGRFIYFSSGAVYDGLQGEVGPFSPVSPTLPYAISKLASEQYVRCFHERRESLGSYLIVRFFGAYGPYEPPHKIYTRLVKAFALEGKGSYTIYGSGRNLIDAMYVGDAIDAILRMVEGTHWNDTLDLASGNPISIEALVHEVGRILGVSPVKLEKAGVAHEDIQFRASTGPLRELYGFEPRTALSGGIPRLRDHLLKTA